LGIAPLQFLSFGGNPCVRVILPKTAAISTIFRAEEVPESSILRVVRTGGIASVPIHWGEFRLGILANGTMHLELVDVDGQSRAQGDDMGAVEEDSDTESEEQDDLDRLHSAFQNIYVDGVNDEVSSLLGDMDMS
jgi:hypothetical protein